MIKFLDSYPAYLNIVWVVIGALVIGLVVYLLRKYIPGLKGEEAPAKDEKEVAEENVKAKLGSLEEEKIDEDEEDIIEDQKAKDSSLEEEKMIEEEEKIEHIDGE